MESSDSSRKSRNLTYGPCRCCGTQGYHRDLLKEYYFKGCREVYAELFLDCFNIIVSKISTVNASKVICTSCVRRLRDANDFREMVMMAESQLLDPLQQVAIGDVQEADLQLEVQPLDIVKSEPVKDEYGSDDDYLDDSFYDIEVEPKPKQEAVQLIPGEAELLARFELSSLTLPRCPPPGAFLNYCKALRGRIITASDVAKLLEQSDAKLKVNGQNFFLTEKRGLIINITTILEHSNVTPFRSKTHAGFPCFFCRKALQNLDEIRNHIKEKHENIDYKKTLWKDGPESLVVNVDITDLKCNICDKDMPNLNELKKHLTQFHKKKMWLKSTDRLIPFKLDGGSYECQMCGGFYETFGSIERHMNNHFRNYVCKDCGAGFVTKYRLKVHIKASHVGGAYPCDICKKVFTSYQRKKTHVDAVHKMLKRFKCTKCTERFTEYFARQKHLVEAHGAEPIQYKCNVCDKRFDRRYNLSRHLKRDHLQEKTQSCEICGYRCFAISELKTHMIKHVGERTHECPYCKKAYARKKTLTEHLKIHTNDRRHTCSVCGQAFIQKCSLKGHIKTHHPELITE